MLLLEKTYKSPAHCANEIQDLIPGLSIVQTETADNTQISVRINALGEHLFMRWHVSCRCLFYGPRRSDGLPLGFITHDWSRAKDCWTQGDWLVPGCLAGTRFERDEMYFGMGANTTLDVAFVPEKAFIKRARLVCGDHLVNRLTEINVCLPESSHLQQLERAVLCRLLDEGHDSGGQLADQLVLIVMQLLDNAFDNDQLIQPPKSRWEIQKAIIDYADQLPPGKAPTVKDLASCVRYSEDTLIRACRDKWGLKPLDLMKMVCLEQARRLILNPEHRKIAGLRGIGTIHKRFGWKSSAKFAANYQKLFGTRPSDEFVKADRD